MVKIVKHDPHNPDHMCVDCLDQTVYMIVDLIEGDCFGVCRSCYNEYKEGCKVKIVGKVV